MKIPMILKTEYVITSSSVKALKEALRLRKAGKQVLIMTKDTFLASDICAAARYNEVEELKSFLPEQVYQNGMLHPDSLKRYLEQECEKAGIRLLYFAWPVAIIRQELQTVLLAASKGGIFEICCSRVLFFEKEGVPEKLNAFLEKENSKTYDIITAQTDSVGPGIAETLLLLRQELLEQFKKKRQQESGLKLGRFAVRGYRAQKKELEPVKTEQPKTVSLLSNLLPEGAVLSCESDLTWVNSHEAAKIAAQITGSRIECELLVAGGGTAGAMAALHGARAGMHTVLVEPNYDLGGTSTLGGVSTYWFGNRFSDVKEVDEEVESICRCYGIERKEGIWSSQDDFHPGIKGMVLLKLCLEAGVDVHFGELAWAAVKQDERVRGIVTASEEGNRLYLADTVIDATGDGDIAVFAGAASCYGSDTDCITYWGSLAQYTDACHYRNNFSSMLSCADPLDYTRFILLGRKRGENTFDHGTYVSMRESRHIKGLEEVNLKDLITFRTWPDGLYTCFSNYDPKGKLDADMVYAGFLPPQIKMQIPLSALLPVDKKGNPIKGICVAGKAISATHNAFPGIRMQPDLMHQGAQLGALAGYAFQQGVFMEELSAEERNTFLTSYSDDPLKLPEWNQNTGEALNAIKEESRTHWVDVPFTYQEEKQNECLTLLCADEEELAPLLRERMQWETNQEVRSLFTSIALFHGMDDWTEEYCMEIGRALEESRSKKEGLPIRKGSVMCAQLLPDHGVMPEIVYRLNTLGWSKKECILKPFGEILAMLKEEQRDYLSIQKGIYHYIEAFAHAAERNASRSFIPMLEELCSFQEFENVLANADSADLMTERLQILYFRLCSALAGLGAQTGYDGLTRLMTADCLPIRASAAMRYDSLRQEKGEKNQSVNKRRF